MVAVLGQAVIERIDRVFAAWDSAVSPGCALRIYLYGEFAFGRGYGMSNLEHGIPIDDPENVSRGIDEYGVRADGLNLLVLCCFRTARGHSSPGFRGSGSHSFSWMLHGS